MSENENQNEKKETLESLASKDNVHQKATEMMVKSIFMKHGITKDKVNPLSDEQKDQLLDLVADFKAQAEAFIHGEKISKKKSNKYKRRS